MTPDFWFGLIGTASGMTVLILTGVKYIVSSDIKPLETRTGALEKISDRHEVQIHTLEVSRWNA